MKNQIIAGLIVIIPLALLYLAAFALQPHMHDDDPWVFKLGNHSVTIR